MPIPAAEKASRASKPLLTRLGMVLSLYRIVSRIPAALETLVNAYAALEKGDLDTLTRERIALAVAEANGCDNRLSAQVYRVRQGEMLDDIEITANRSGASNDIKADPAVHFAAKLARDRGAVSNDDVAAVKEAGCSDAEIVAHVAVNIFT